MTHDTYTRLGQRAHDDIERLLRENKAVLESLHWWLTPTCWVIAEKNFDVEAFLRARRLK